MTDASPWRLHQVPVSAMWRLHSSVADGGTEECIDLQFMRAVPNNPVGLYDCGGLGGIGAADAGLNWPLVDAEAAI